MYEIHGRHHFDELFCYPKKHGEMFEKACSLARNGNGFEQASAWMDIAGAKAWDGDAAGAFEALEQLRRLNEDGKLAALMGTLVLPMFRRSREAVDGCMRAFCDGNRTEVEMEAKRLVAECNALSPSEVWNAFSRDEAAAEDRYKGQTFGVKGRIGKTAALPHGRPMILFHAGGHGAVTVGFVFEHRGEAAKMKQGRTALLGGECAGLRNGMVVFEDSFIVPEKKKKKKNGKK